MSLRLFGIFICVKFHVFEIFVDHIYGICNVREFRLRTDIITQIVNLRLQTSTFNTNFRFGPDSIWAVIQLIVLVIVEKYVYFWSILIELAYLKVVPDASIETSETTLTLFFGIMTRHCGYLAITPSSHYVLLSLLLHNLTWDCLNSLYLLKWPNLMITYWRAASSSTVTQILFEIEGCQSMGKHLTA
jgi:hypothetical protein